MRSDEDPNDFLYKKGRYRDRLNSVTPKEDPPDRRHEDIILQYLPPEYEMEDCNLADIRRMMSKIYADNLARSHSDSSRGIAERGVAMQATGRDLSKINCHYCNKFGHSKNDCADFKANHQQNRRRRQRQHKQRGGHQPDPPKPGVQHQQRGGGQMWCSHHKTTTHHDADCRARPADGLNGNAYFAQVRPPNVSGIDSSWDLPVRDDSNEKPCISFLAKEVQPATEPAKARVDKEKGARPLGPVRPAVPEVWGTRSWPFIPRAGPQPAAKPAKVRVEEEKGARPFGQVSTAATEGWRTHPWPFTSRADQAISFGGPVAEVTFGMANDGELVEKALMASSSVSVTSEDSARSNLATRMSPAESLPGEVREPLSGEASMSLLGGALTPLSGGAPTPLPEGPSTHLSGEASTHLSGGASTRLSGRASTRLSGGASTPSGVRASLETARPSPAPVPATARTGGPIRNIRIHRPNVVTRRAAAELTSVVTRYRRVHPNKNNNNDGNNINNNNNNHAALAECFQPSMLHKLRQPGLYTNTDTPDDNDINNNNHAALAEHFQPSTLHKLRQLGIYPNTNTPDDNDINNNNHAALAARFQPSTLHKVRQLGRYTNTDTPDTAHQLDAEAAPATPGPTRSRAVQEEENRPCL